VMMLASDAGRLLSAIARGGSIDLGADQEAHLETLASAGLVRRAPEANGEQRARMNAMKAELAQIAAARTLGHTSADLAGRERGLRTAIVELSEQLAESEGATEVRSRTGSGPYRDGGGRTSRWQITQRGRTLLNDLAPRIMRLENESLAGFEAQMKWLRDTFAWRAERAATIAKTLEPQQFGRAVRSVPIGLSAVRADPERVARAFTRTFGYLRQMSSAFTPEQDAAAAECLCIAAHDLSACERHDAAQWFHALRGDLMARFTQQQTEDALDAAMLLAGAPTEQHAPRIEVAAELARVLSARQMPITLSLALAATTGDAQLADHLHTALANLQAALGQEVHDPYERALVAVLLTAPRGDLNVQVDRWRTLRQYLSRFSPDGMAVAAALLSWIGHEPAETLDDLRLASAALTKARLAHGSAEAMALGIKLLLAIAALAQGSEGDHEEKLALAPRAQERMGFFGLHGALAAMPLVFTAAAPFHRTVLDATETWAAAHQPMHSSYVFGGGGYRRSYGWG
jgi:hypothetical protein